MERPLRCVEYICLSCGAQGLAELQENESGSGENGRSFECPKCGGAALSIERRTVFDLPAAVYLGKR